MKLSKINATLQEQIEAIARLKAELNNTILSLPDNPNIKRLAPNCFIMQSSQLEDNWTPEFYDFKQQYQAIVAIIEGGQLDAVVSILEEIIANGKIRNKSKNKNIFFHPEVVKHLKTLLM